MPGLNWTSGTIYQPETEAEVKWITDDLLAICQAQGKLIYQRLNSGTFIVDKGTERQRPVKGCKKGTADFHVDMPGRSIYLETKSRTGKQTPAQKEFEAEVKAVGCEYHLVRSYEDIAEILKLVKE